MPDRLEGPSHAVRHARVHIETLEDRIERRRYELLTEDHAVDEATAQRWLNADEDQLATWRTGLEEAMLAAETLNPPP